MKSLLAKVDAVVLRVPSLEAGLEFYRDHLGHELIWRNETMAGLRLNASDTELVLTTNLDQETDLLVDSVDTAVDVIRKAGGAVLAGPDDIPVGRVAVVRDPFGNRLTLVDLSRGRYVTDDAGDVVGLREL
jgi:predicted enzyme related to lactoylglutathione lyase